MAKVPWKMDLQTYEDYLNILEELEYLDPDFDYEAYMELREQLQRLDNFPLNYDPDVDVVVPVVNEPIMVLNVPKDS